MAVRYWHWLLYQKKQQSNYIIRGTGRRASTNQSIAYQRCWAMSYNLYDEEEGWIEIHCLGYDNEYWDEETETYKYYDDDLGDKNVYYDGLSDSFFYFENSEQMEQGIRTPYQPTSAPISYTFQINATFDDNTSESYTVSVANNGNWSVEYPSTKKIVSIEVLADSVHIFDYDLSTVPPCTVLSFDFSNADDFSNVTDTSDWFSGLGSIQSVNLSNTTFSNLENADDMFSGCMNLTSINMQNVSFDSLETADGMFGGVPQCPSYIVPEIFAAPNLQTSIQNVDMRFVSGDVKYRIMTTTDVNVVSHNYTGAITIPSTVFYGNTTFNVTDIADYAFSESGVTSVVIPNSITSIGEGVFYGCSNLSDVTIPSSVTEIESYAFGYSGLNTIVVPSTVTTIGYSAFAEVYMIVYTGSATGSTWGASIHARVIDGDFVYSDNNKTYLALYTGSASSVTVPSTVTTIGDNVFKNKTTLTSVTIPSTVTSIGIGAFYNTGLTSITIPSSVTSVGDYAFEYSDNITSATINTSLDMSETELYLTINGIKYKIISESVAYIFDVSTTAFTGAHAVPSSLTAGNTYAVTRICESAYSGCANITSFTVPSSITHIETQAFANTGATTITLPYNPYLAYGAFRDCKQLVSMVNPVYIYDNRGLGMVRIPSFYYMFENCENVVNFSDILNAELDSGALSDYAVNGIRKNQTFEGLFKNCKKLKDFDSDFTVQLCKDLYYAEDFSINFKSMFDGCNALESVEFKNTSSIPIGNMSYMYRNCTALTYVKMLKLKSSSYIQHPNTRIYSNDTEAESVFDGCENLETLYLGSDAGTQDAVWLNNDITTFRHCYQLTNVTLYGNIYLKYAVSFADCQYLTYESMVSICSHLLQFSSYEIDRIITFNSTAFSNITGDATKTKSEKQQYIRDLCFDRYWQISFE